MLNSLRRLIRREPAQKNALDAANSLNFPVWNGGSGRNYYGVSGNNRDLQRSKYGAALAAELVVPVYRSADLRTRAIGGLGWSILRRDDDTVFDTSDEPSPEHPLAKAIQRSQKLNGFPLFALVENSLSLTGMSFLEPVQNDYGYHTNIAWLNPLSVEIDAPLGHINAYRYYGHGKALMYNPHEIVYQRYMNLNDDVYGVGPAEIAINSINIDRNLKREIVGWLRNGMRVGGILSPSGAGGAVGGGTLMQSALEELKNQVRASIGVDNAGKTIVSPEPLSATFPDPVDMSKNIELLRKMEDDVYAAFGVDRALAGNTDTSTYQSAPQIEQWFMTRTILPEARVIAQMVNYELMPYFDQSGEYYFAFDTSEWDRIGEDEKTRATQAREAFNDGALTMNQYLTAIGQDAVPGGDVLYIPSNVQVVPANALNQLPQLTQPAPPPPETNPASEAPAQVIEEAATDSDATKHATGCGCGACNPSDAPPAPDPEPDEPPLTIEEKDNRKRAELNAWQTYIKKRLKAGKSYSDFTPEYTRGDLGDFVADHVNAANGDFDAIKEVFTQAYEKVAYKAIWATRIDFDHRLEDIITSVRNGQTQRRQFTVRVGQLLRTTIPRAYRDGLEDGGVTTDEFTDEEQAEINEIVAAQRENIRRLGNELYSETGISDAQAREKPSLWWNGSISPAYNAGITSAAGNKMQEWVLGSAEEHCTDCLRLDGQRHRRKTWAKRNLIPQTVGMDTECGGWQCKCGLKDTDGRARGRF